MKKILAYLLAILMVCVSVPFTGFAESAPGDAQLTMEDLQNLNGGEVQTDLQNGKVTFVEGTCTNEKVTSVEDAQKVLDSMRNLMGGDAHFHFEPWNVLHDSFGNVYYVFQQTHADQIVLGGAVKVITDSEGTMIGLTSTVVSDLPDEAESEGLTREQAEAVVLEHESKADHGSPELIEGMTSLIVLPVTREVDLDADELYTHFVWAVYTTNPSASVSLGSDLPYLAHYVSMSGEYLYSLPTILPGDTAGSAGYDASYTFQFMEPVDYTGYVDWSDGSEHEISISLMRDTRTGMYYLGNLEHRIVVADCWEFLYNGGRVVMEYSPDNLEWDQTSLQSLYNYCLVYDYYKELGWLGGDGAQTPIIVLKDFCDANHNPTNNAAYAGNFYGWQTFLSSSVNDFAQCLDVCAHEFTHCVTHSVMTYNAYMNDYGAINEAISDIQGNVCEMIMGKTEDTTWKIAENCGSAIRSMSDPNRYNQPRYSWDLYYQPNVKTPSAVNDRGGVHTNSSLLNYIAYWLCEKGGMSLEEARAFWFAVDCTMVPGTNYPQLRKLLPSVLHMTHLDAYADCLSEAIALTRLGDADTPSQPGDQQVMMKLELPDNEVFNNGNWAMTVLTINMENLASTISSYFDAIQQNEYDRLPDPLRKLMEYYDQKQQERKEKGFLDMLTELITKPERTEEEKAEEKAINDEFIRWMQSFFRENYYNGNASVGQDGSSILLMSIPGYTIPCLMYVKLQPGSQEPEQVKFVAYFGNQWLDLAQLFSNGSEAGKETGAPHTQLFTEVFEKIFSGKGWKEILDDYILYAQVGTTVEIPNTGLENVTLDTSMPINKQKPPVVKNRKSRPKLSVEENSNP